MMTAAHSGPKIIYVVTEDWYFISHRIDLAAGMRRAGWDVILATRINSEEASRRISKAGIRIENIPIERGRLFSLGDLGYLWRLLWLYERERPALVHHVAMKPALYGSIAALLLLPTTGVINAFGGLGHLFSGVSGLKSIIRGLVENVFRLLFRFSRVGVIMQNPEDHAHFERSLNIPGRRLFLIRGAGVDVAAFRPHPVALGRTLRVIMVSRMLAAKGVLEFVAAARIVGQRGFSARFLLVGPVDQQNPDSLEESELRRLSGDGVVEWLGPRSDVADLYGGSDVAVLPSKYKEGVPKSLLEAAACGLPIIASNIAGCREIVRQGVNGLLVPAGDAQALADAICSLLSDSALRERLGRESRRIAEKEFSHDRIHGMTRNAYARVMPVETRYIV